VYARREARLEIRLTMTNWRRRVYKGRKASIDPAKVKDLKAKGMGPSAIAKALKIGRASVYRALQV
jgi:DNA invertase Pin-like site-specific DNA recombinase